MNTSIEPEKEMAAMIEELVQRVADALEGCPETSCFEDMLAEELQKCEVPFERDVWIAEKVAGCSLNCGQQVDFVLNKEVALVVSYNFEKELAAEARLTSILRLLELHSGILIVVDSGCKAEVRHMHYE